MLNIVKQKECKRCGGDLFLEKDAEGTYVSRLQCGATFERRSASIPLCKAEENVSFYSIDR
jgi:hypothetical protein